MSEREKDKGGGKRRRTHADIVTESHTTIGSEI